MDQQQLTPIESFKQANLLLAKYRQKWWTLRFWIVLILGEYYFAAGLFYKTCNLLDDPDYYWLGYVEAKRLIVDQIMEHLLLTTHMITRMKWLTKRKKFKSTLYLIANDVFNICANNLHPNNRVLLGVNSRYQEFS